MSPPPFSSTTRHTVREVEQEAGSIERRSWFRRLMRAGLISRCIIYLLLTYLTADIASHGRSPSPADSNGALQEVARQWGGRVLLVALAVGLAGYALWRFVSAAAPSDLDRAEPAKRLGVAIIGLAYVSLCVEAAELIVGSGETANVSSNPGPLVATVLRWPGGAGLVGIVATGLIAGGLVLAVWGWAHDYAKTVNRPSMSPRMFGVMRVTGTIGDSARGLLIVLVGCYLMAGAVTDDPAHVKGLDQALRSLSRHPYGVWVLSIGATGLFFYAIFSAFEALYRSA